MRFPLRIVFAFVSLLAVAAALQGQSSAYSTSALPDDPDTPVAAYHAAAATDQVFRTPRPFHSVAVEAKVGINGIGFDLATPMSDHFNLRGGAQFFNHSLNPNADGLHTVGELTLQNVQVSVDWFPFRKSSFHLSPGVTVHNDNHLFSSIYVPGGASFSLGDADYISDPNSPINGYARSKLGNSVAPRITLGWGNMIPHDNGHLSFPVEFGFQYISSPTVDLHLYGNACDNMGNCGDINANDGPDNIASEITMLNQDISGFRFFPIFSIGVSYKFGH